LLFNNLDLIDPNMKKLQLTRRNTQTSKGHNQVNTFPKIPRNIVSSYPLKITATKLRFSYSTIFNGSALYYFDNVHVRSTVYQPISGVSQDMPGKTAMAILYNGVLVKNIRTSVTINNMTAVPLSFCLLPMRTVSLDHATSFVDFRSNPDAKHCIVNGVGRNLSQRTMVHSVDVSKMVGYDVTSTNLTAHWQSWLSNPSSMAGINIITAITDGVTVLSCDVNIVTELDCVLFNPNLLVN